MPKAKSSVEIKNRRASFDYVVNKKFVLAEYYANIFLNILSNLL